MIHLSPEAERRFVYRGRSFLGGVLLYGNGWLTRDCTVRNLTGRGARVRLVGQEALSDPVILVVPSKKDAFEAEIVWRIGGELGLRFNRKCDLSDGVTDGEKIAARLLQARQS